MQPDHMGNTVRDSRECFTEATNGWTVCNYWYPFSSAEHSEKLVCRSSAEAQKRVEIFEGQLTDSGTEVWTTSKNEESQIRGR